MARVSTQFWTSTGRECSICVTAPAPPSGSDPPAPHSNINMIFYVLGKKIWNSGTLTSYSWNRVALSSISLTLRSQVVNNILISLTSLRQVCEQEAEGERIRKQKEVERRIDEDFGSSRLGRIRSFCWNMTEYPETGRAAQVSPSLLLIAFIHDSLICCRFLHW